MCSNLKDDIIELYCYIYSTLNLLGLCLYLSYYEEKIMKNKEFKPIIKEYLKHRKEDKYYKKYSNIKIDSELKSIVTKELNSNFWKGKFNIGYYKDYYAEGITLSQFINNILKKVDVKLYKQTLNELVKYIKTMYNISFSDSEIKEAIYYRMFYKNYVGFLFEDLLVEFLQNEEFEIIQSKELDNKYKIDLLLKHKNYDSLIGIQCKNESYLKVKKSIKDNHTAQHNKAIENEICNEVIFLLYDSNFNIFVNYGIPIEEGKLVKFIKNKFENRHKKILIQSANR